MPREKKDAKLLSIKLDRNVHEQLERFCLESGLTKTMAVEKILSQFLTEYFSKSQQDRSLFQR